VVARVAYGYAPTAIDISCQSFDDKDQYVNKIMTVLLW